jgi:ribosomal protein L37AE/L43A
LQIVPGQLTLLPKDEIMPSGLYAGGNSPSFVDECAAESDSDVRHIGRYLSFAYECFNCGTQIVELTPDYPYCGANSTWTCKHCAAVMRLKSPIPIKGTPKKCMTTIIRSSS